MPFACKPTDNCETCPHKKECEEEYEALEKEIEEMVDANPMMYECGGFRVQP